MKYRCVRCACVYVCVASAAYGEIAFASDADVETNDADKFFLDVLNQRDVVEVFVGNVGNTYSSAL